VVGLARPAAGGLQLDAGALGERVGATPVCALEPLLVATW